VNTLSYKTLSANKATVTKEWLIIDATNQPLGRLSSTVAKLIRGKHKPYFTPHVDCGDKVIVINAEKVLLTGKKMDDKRYIRYTGYPGGQREISPRNLIAKKPTALVEVAVKGMLPKNILGNALLKNLFVYAGSEHKQQAQQPREIKLESFK
jgi:large subunit ribosomal protein L13